MVVELCLEVVVYLLELFEGVTKSRKAVLMGCVKGLAANYNTDPSRHPVHRQPVRERLE